MNNKVFGIAVHYPQNTNREQVYFGNTTNYIRDLIEEANKKNWTGFVFSPQDVLRRRGVVWGFVRSSGIWRRSFLPIPSVCYLQIGMLSDSDREILNWMSAEMSTQYINSPHVVDILSDRWRSLQIMISHPTLVTKVVETNLYKGARDLGDQINDEENGLCIYPRFRSNNSFMEIKKTGKSFRVREYSGKTIKSSRLKTLDEIDNRIIGLFGEAIVQPKIKTFNIDGYPIVIRTYWQKDVIWSNSLTVLRIGQKESYGRLATIGAIDDHKNLFAKKFKSFSESILYQIESVSKACAELLEQRTHGIHEITVDYLLTTHGNLLLYDVNHHGIETAVKVANPEVKHNLIQKTLRNAEIIYKNSHIDRFTV